jgi:RNA polymerase sigma factor (sigma-70 family)
MPRAPTDAELVAAALDGDRLAFSALITRHGPRARTVAVSLLRGSDGAEDVEQEAVLAAYLGLSRLREPARFGAWLSAIAANLARMRLRGRETSAFLGELEERHSIADSDSKSPEEALEAAELLRLVERGLASLSESQRAIVLMHYAEGRTCEEISALVGRSPVAVRVGLHRARAQLRERLGPSLERETPIRMEDYPMVEVTVSDVVVRMIPGRDEESHLAKERMRIVLLREKEAERARVLPIWIGSFEGDALALELGGEAMARPLTADLMVRLLQAAGAGVERVTITSLRDNTFYAVITVAGAGGTEDVDARPSDALNLATRVGSPIFVEESVLVEAGVDADGDLEARLTEETAKYSGESVAGAEWRSLSPTLVKALHRPPSLK